MRDRLINEMSVHLEEMSEKERNDPGGLRLLHAIGAFFAAHCDREKQRRKKKSMPQLEILTALKIIKCV